MGKCSISLPASDFRIGNYIIDNSGAYNKLSSIHGGCKYRAIPITPEILEKCGFKAPGYGLFKPDLQFGLNNGFSIQFYKNGNIFCLDKWFSCDTCFPESKWELPIEYLHDLQNSFYYITGQELTVN